MTLVIKDGDPFKRWTDEQTAEINRSAPDGTARFHEILAGLELVDGGWRRFPSGWYVEVCRGGEWRRELGPFDSSLFEGVPREAIAAAEAAGLSID